jgi:hypothetical protein
MAKVAGNIILHGASGTIGGQIVVRQRGKTVILAQAPGARSKEATPAQVAQQQHFQRAIVYGTSTLADAESKAAYASKATASRSGYNVAVADFMHAPNIDEIDVTNYSGAAGDTIRIRATDDFEVKQVTISIHNADGSLVEAGDAVQQANKIDWIYMATAENTDTAGDRIEIRALDRPGNVADVEQVL